MSVTKHTVALVTDSSCDLSPEYIQKYQIGVVPMYIMWGLDSYKDGVELGAPAFYARLVSDDERQQHDLIKTSQPSPEDFASVYQHTRDGQDANEIICITLSKKLSGTFNSAEKAAALVDFPVRVVDSTSVSLGVGFAVLAAAAARERGASPNEIAVAARTVGEKSQVIFTVNSLDYLHRGGRVSSAQRLIGTALNIKPILAIRDGAAVTAENIRTRKRALARLLELLRCIDAAPGALRIAVLDGAAREEADQLAAEIQAALQPIELFRGTLSPTIGAHTGPGLIGVGAVPADAY